jgi:hypothetical protein
MVWKIVTLVFVAGTVVVLGLRVASAQSAPAAPACNNQPNMAAALGALQEARALLEKAADNKGGWRVQAIQSTDLAISQTTRGCSFADTH